MNKIFYNLKSQEIEIKIFVKIIKLKYNFEIDLKHRARSQYSCYDLCVLLAHLEELCSELEIVKIENWVNENCEYIMVDKNKKPNGTQLNLF